MNQWAEWGRGAGPLWLLSAALAAAPGLAGAAPVGVWSNGVSSGSLYDFHGLGGATLLPDGRVLAAGGGGLVSVFTKQPIATAELYDPVSRGWSLTGSLDTARWALDAVTLGNGKALFAGGSSVYASVGALASAEIYDPLTGMFSYTANALSVARQSYGISTLADGRVLITGGNTSGNSLNGTGVGAVDLYDPASNAFSAAAPMNFGRSLHAQVTLADGRVVVVGGARNDAEIYDPASNSWTVASGTLPTTLKDMKAFELHDGRVFIAGGQDVVNGATSDRSWYFDPGTGLFTEGPSMAGVNYAPEGVQVGASDYSAFDLYPVGHPLRGRYILYAGGEHNPANDWSADVVLHSSSVFDALNGVFVDMGPMPFPHDDHTEAALGLNALGNPEVLLFGGNSSSGTSRFEFITASVSPGGASAVPLPAAWLLLAGALPLLRPRRRAGG